MRLSRPLLLLAMLSLPSLLRADLQPNDRVAVIGDSITEQKQYSVFIEDYLLMCQPAPSLWTVQVGWSGETSWGFLNRMNQDAVVFKPTVATTCYGMNDGGYAALTPETAKHYRDSMTTLVKNLKAAGVRSVVVGSPGMVDPDTFPPSYIAKSRTVPPEYPKVYNATLASLRDIAKEVAQAEGVTFADVYDAMMDAGTKAKAKYGHAYHVAGPDGVHPSANGHIIMAYAFLKAMGCTGDIGAFTYDCSSHQGTVSDGHKLLSADNTSLQIESSKYPFCFHGDPADPSSTTGIIEFLPFNQDLNRLTLTLKNAPAKVKITWGDTSKEFSKADAEKGINLAAEFLDNPFSAKFKEVESAIRKQQTFETPMIKTVFHLPPAAGLDALKAGVIDEDDSLRSAAAAQVTPLKHTIKIEPAE